MDRPIGIFDSGVGGLTVARGRRLRLRGWLRRLRRLGRQRVRGGSREQRDVWRVWDRMPPRDVPDGELRVRRGLDRLRRRRREWL